MHMAERCIYEHRPMGLSLSLSLSLSISHTRTHTRAHAQVGPVELFICS